MVRTIYRSGEPVEVFEPTRVLVRLCGGRVAERYVCPACSRMVVERARSCRACGAPLSWPKK